MLSLVIIPDFVLENNEGELIVSLNSRNTPDLRINSTYQEMLKTYTKNRDKNSAEQREAINFVKQKIDSAKVRAVTGR